VGGDIPCPQTLKDVGEGFKALGNIIGVTPLIEGVGSAVENGWNSLNEVFSKGGGSTLTSSNFSNSNPDARTPTSSDGEINVDEFIGPTLRADPAENMAVAISLGSEMVEH